MPSRAAERRSALHPRGPVFWAKWLQLAALVCITLTMLGAARSPYERVGHELMCVCGCGQVLLECNHVGCTDSARMIGELRQQIASGASDSGILAWFTAKYGPTVMAAPMRSGFDRVAWIAPFAVFALATLATFATVWVWRRRAPALVGASPQALPSSATPRQAALRDRIRRETEF